jgi:hypothetical protein
MQQTVYGLRPSTRYTLRAFAKTTGGATAKLGVKEYGGPVVLTSERAANVNMYRPPSLSFITSVQATSATVFCWSQNDGAAFFDDVRLEYVLEIDRG